MFSVYLFGLLKIKLEFKDDVSSIIMNLC